MFFVLFCFPRCGAFYIRRNKYIYVINWKRRLVDHTESASVEAGQARTSYDNQVQSVRRRLSCLFSMPNAGLAAELTQ